MWSSDTPTWDSAQHQPSQFTATGIRGGRCVAFVCDHVIGVRSTGSQLPISDKWSVALATEARLGTVAGLMFWWSRDHIPITPHSRRLCTARPALTPRRSSLDDPINASDLSVVCSPVCVRLDRCDHWSGYHLPPVWSEGVSRRRSQLCGGASWGDAFSLVTTFSGHLDRQDCGPPVISETNPRLATPRNSQVDR